MSKSKLINQIATENSVLRDRLYNHETSLATKLRAVQALYEMVDRVAENGGKHAPWWAARLTSVSKMFEQYDKIQADLEELTTVNRWLSETNEQLLAKLKEKEQEIANLYELI